jgi:hypothetical protein
MIRKAFGLALLAVFTSSAQANEAQLAGAELKAAVSGKTVYVQTPLGEVPIRYLSNGTLHGQTELALFDGESQTADRGRWWVSGSALCMQWQNWMQGQQHCFTMRRLNGPMLFWQRDDGKTGMARLG